MKNLHLFLLPADRTGSQVCKMWQHIYVGLKLWSGGKFLSESSNINNSTPKSDFEPFI